MAQIKDGSSFLDGKKIPKSVNGVYADSNGNIQIEAISEDFDLKNNNVTFTEANTRTNIGSGESMSILFGKIQKWFADLKSLAFKEFVSESDLDTNLSGLINNKVDKELNKQLSTNDFTNELKDKLESIQKNAEVNVQSNWSETNTSSDAFILNKPTKLSQFENDPSFITMENLVNYATQKWVIDQGFATIEYVDGLIGLAETNLSKVVSIETEFTPDPYVPLVPEVGSDDYATQQWVIDKGYATIVYVNSLIGTSLETLSNLVV